MAIELTDKTFYYLESRKHGTKTIAYYTENEYNRTQQNFAFVGNSEEPPIEYVLQEFDILGKVPDYNADMLLMPKTLTAENGAKGALSGTYRVSYKNECTSCLGTGNNEFGYNCNECHGRGYMQLSQQIPWDTIKDIYRKAVATVGFK